MKKRFVTTLIAFIACIGCLFGLVACGDDADPVAGKTYVFDKVEITEGLEGSAKEEAETQLNNMYKDSYLEFGNDDGFTMMTFGHSMEGTYAQDGSKLTLTVDDDSLEGKVSGDTVILSNSMNGMSASMIYKLSPKTNAGGSENDGENEGGNQGGNENEGGNQGGNEENPPISADTFAGKTYKMTDYLVNGESVFETMSAQMGELKIVFGQNGSCTMTSGGTPVSGTYTVSGNTVAITVEGDSLNFTVEGNTLKVSQTMTEGGTAMTLTMVFTLQA